MQSTTYSLVRKDADKLEAELVALSGRMNAAEYVSLRLVRELEDAIMLEDWTYPQWLAWRCNLSNKTAYERVRVARALVSLPHISGAFAEGRLSYSKVRILTRMATAATDAEYLRDALLMSVHQLEVLVAKHRRVSTADAERHTRERFLQIYEDDNGSFVVRGRLTPDDAAIVIKALHAADPDQSKVDALVQVASAAVEHLAAGDDTRLHVVNDVATHSEDCHCEVEGIPIAKATADRLCCENPHGRYISSVQRRVLSLRQGGCCGFPGCRYRRYLHGHHMIHWADGGLTTLDNLILVCSKHHRALHEGRYRIDRSGTVRNRHGRVVPNSPSFDAIPDYGLHDWVPATTDLRGRDLWDGSRQSYDEPLEAILRREDPERWGGPPADDAPVVN